MAVTEALRRLATTDHEAANRLLDRLEARPGVGCDRCRTAERRPVIAVSKRSPTSVWRARHDPARRAQAGLQNESGIPT
jgi:hypothetical protein